MQPLIRNFRKLFFKQYHRIDGGSIAKYLQMDMRIQMLFADDGLSGETNRLSLYNHITRLHGPNHGQVSIGDQDTISM